MVAAGATASPAVLIVATDGRSRGVIREGEGYAHGTGCSRVEVDAGSGVADESGRGTGRTRQIWSTGSSFVFVTRQIWSTGSKFSSMRMAATRLIPLA